MCDIIGQDNELITEDDKTNVKCVYLCLEPALTKQIQVELTPHSFEISNIVFSINPVFASPCWQNKLDHIGSLLQLLHFQNFLS